MNRIKLAVVIGAVAVGGLAADIASAQFAKPEAAVRYRKSAFSVMATHFSRIGSMVKGETPFNAAQAQANMAIIETMHKLPFDAFGPGTDAAKSEAKPEVWSKAAEFKQAQTNFYDNVTKLSAAVKTGNMEQIKPAFGATGKSCKECHDGFKRE